MKDDSFRHKVSIVILVWNDYENTRECLESCARLNYEGLEVIVVDNASIDGSCTRLAVEFPWAEFVFNQENRGYADGNNIGIRTALDHGAEYILIINNDIVIDSVSLVQEMVNQFIVTPGLGILAPRILQLTTTGTYVYIPYKSALYDYIKKYFLPTDQKRLPLTDNSKILEQIVVPGCAIMLSRELLLKVGCFNKDFFMFEEEDDLCLRAAKAGFLVAKLNDEELLVKHKGGASYKGLPPWKAFLLSRNRFLQLRSFSLYTQPLIVLIHFLSICRLLLLAMRKGEYRASFGYAFGFISGLSLWFKDLLGISKDGEYLIEARNLVQGKSRYAKLLNIGL